MSNVVHLHLHTGYSIKDASAKISEVAKKVASLGQPAVAITDHGNMFGVVEFYLSCKKAKVKPIIGCEMYVCPQGKKALVRNNRHIVLLAKDNVGYGNLIKIMSDAAENGFYYNPRTDYEFLKSHSEGLICLSACLGGDIPKSISEATTATHDGIKEGNEKLDLYIDIFGKENVYLEVQDNGIKSQYEMNEKIIRLSQISGVPLVLTNDVHYVNHSDAKYHDILLALDAKTTTDDKVKRKVYETDQFFIKSYEQMDRGVVPMSAIENTLVIADRCNVELDFKTLHIPEFEYESQFESSYAQLEYLVKKGMVDKYGEDALNPIHVERVRYELEVISNMGYIDYFLIVWDFVDYAKRNGILVGPGRGSAAGSIVSYALDITTIDPIKYNLIFERFLNPSRISMPDIDWDSQDSRRQEVIDYVIAKYGADHVAQIITFGTFAAKASIRAVGRAIKECDYNLADKIAKMVPAVLKITIKEAMDMNMDMRQLYESDEVARMVIDGAMAIEGLPSNTSTHAAGVLITPRPISEYVPTWVNNESSDENSKKKKRTVVCQFDMEMLEKLGLLKMDFLGLKTLSVIDTTVKSIKENYGVVITAKDIDNMPDDPNAYIPIQKGQTAGIFQVESEGMTKTAMELKPENLEENGALISLYRPGPMDFIPDYIHNKNHPEDIVYLFPEIEEIVKPTYGVLTYQEQVMEMSRVIAGYTMADADNLRKAIGKKIDDLIALNREHFVYGKEEGGNVLIPGAVRMGHPERVVADYYDDVIVPFGKYAFNKSHGISYAVISAQTGWLKYYYPTEYMAGIMTHNFGKPEKISAYILHCKQDLGIDILPPNINLCGREFLPTKDGKIFFGLSAIKNVGEDSIDALVEERRQNGPYKSFKEFIRRCLWIEGINRQSIEALIFSGAMDVFGIKRSQMIFEFSHLLEIEKKLISQKGQQPLFMEPLNDEDSDLRFYEYPDSIRLLKEIGSTGIYITGHPMQAVSSYAAKHSTIKSTDLIIPEEYDGDDDDWYLENRVYNGRQVTIVGLIREIRKAVTKAKKENMAFLTVEDIYGQTSISLFPKTYERVKGLIGENKVFKFDAKINLYQGQYGLMGSESIEEVTVKKSSSVYICVNNRLEVPGIMSRLKSHCETGNVRVYILCGSKAFLTKKEYWISHPSIEILKSNKINFKLVEN